MIQINGLSWPDDVGDKWQHAMAHVKSLDWTLERCAKTRTAVQAGGNIGLWPRRLSDRFQQVLTFEPDSVSRECLIQNVPEWVEVHEEALGATFGRCRIKHRSLGSHTVVDGDDIPVWPLDDFALTDVDLIQLDVEGYEWHALKGAENTIRRCKPLIQVELRGFTEKYGASDSQVSEFLGGLGYQVIGERPGSDVVFRCGN